MIATCPACGKRYRLADDSVPATGRNVRCAACGHGWLARSDGDAPAIASTAAEPWALPPGPAVAVAAGDTAMSASDPRPPGAGIATMPTAGDAEPAWSTVDDAPPRRRHIGWIAAVVAVLAVAALAMIEFAPENTFDPPRLGLPAARLPLADLGSLSVPQLPVVPPLDLTRVPLVGDTLDRLVHPPATPASPLRIAASGERRTLANGTRVLTVSGAVTNPTAAPVALGGIDAALLDPSGYVAFRWRIAAPADVIGPHGQAAFESVTANFPAGATVLRLRLR